jgi:hypothetical protein
VLLNQCIRCTRGRMVPTYNESICYQCGYVLFETVASERKQQTSSDNTYTKNRPASYRPHPMRQATVTFGFADKHPAPSTCQWHEECSSIPAGPGIYCRNHRKEYTRIWGRYPLAWRDVSIPTRIARAFVQYEYVSSSYGEEECPHIIPGKRAALSQLWIPEEVGVPRERTYMRLRKALEKKLGPLKFLEEAITYAEFYDKDGPSLRLYADLIKQEREELQKDITGSSEV